MPSPGEDIQSWSTTAIDNGSSDPLINWVEGQTRASVNNSSRSELAAHAKNRNLLNGSIVTTGTINAQAFLSGISYTTIPSGLLVRLKVGSGLTNTASTTLNMDGLGAVLIKTANGDNLLGGEFVGNGYVDLLYNGTNWLFLYGREFMFDRITSGGGIIIGHQIFSVPGAALYIPTATMECCIVECIGGGGGGGSAYSSDGAVFVGGGGGAGGYSRKYLTAADVGASLAVAVGPGGGGSGTPTSPGLNGGISSLGVLCFANGGIGGRSSQYGVDSGTGGAGGAVGSGDIAAAGAPGTTGTFNEAGGGVFGSVGGSSIFGGGGGGSGGPGTNYGGGGAGGLSLSTTVVAGGSGSSGVVVITEFAGKGAPGRDGPAGPQGPAGPAGSGSGNVLASGTPTSGQYARWINASTIQGAAAPGMFLLATQTASNSAALNFTTGIDGTYDEYLFVGEILLAEAALLTADLYMQCSTNAGSSWDTGANYYWVGNQTSVTAGNVIANVPLGFAASTAIVVTLVAGQSIYDHIAFEVRMHGPARTGAATNARWKLFDFNSTCHGGGVFNKTNGSGEYLKNTAVNGIRFLFSGGNLMPSGSIRLYGVNKT